MNKKLLSASLMIALFAGSVQADAFYIGAGLGSSKIKIEDQSGDKDTAYTLSTGLSIPLPFIPVRGEVELSQFKSDDVKSQAVAANAYVGLPLLPIVKPYVGFGLADMRLKSGSDKTDWKVVPQYMVGLDVDLPLIPVAGGIEYRYVDTSFEEDGDKFDTKIQTVLVKGRIKF